MYTDGSKMYSGVDAAFTVYYDTFIYEYKITLHRLNSINQAELITRYATDWSMNSRFKNIFIFMDKSSYMVLQRTLPSDPIVKDTYEKLIFYPYKKVTIGWTKAHVVNFGNEKAVELSKLATHTNNSDTVENLPYLISLLKKKM